MRRAAFERLCADRLPCVTASESSGNPETVEGEINTVVRFIDISTYTVLSGHLLVGGQYIKQQGR